MSNFILFKLKCIHLCTCILSMVYIIKFQIFVVNSSLCVVIHLSFTGNQLNVKKKFKWNNTYKVNANILKKLRISFVRLFCFRWSLSIPHNMLLFIQILLITMECEEKFNKDINIKSTVRSWKPKTLACQIFFFISCNSAIITDLILLLS